MADDDRLGEYTEHLELYKPDGEDLVDIGDINDNMDTIDAAIEYLDKHAHCSVVYSDSTVKEGGTVPTLTFSPKDNGEGAESDSVTLNVPYLDENGHILSRFFDKAVVVEVFKVTSLEDSKLEQAQVPDMALINGTGDLYVLTDLTEVVSEGGAKTVNRTWTLIHTSNPTFSTLSSGTTTLGDTTIGSDESSNTLTVKGDSTLSDVTAKDVTVDELTVNGNVTQDTTKTTTLGTLSAQGTTVTTLNATGDVSLDSKLDVDGTLDVTGKSTLGAVDAGATKVNSLTFNDDGLKGGVIVTDLNGKIVASDKISIDELNALDEIGTTKIKDQLNAKLDDTQLVTSWQSPTSDDNIPSEKLVKNSLDGKAPTSHASNQTTYGASSASNYGHAKASSTSPKVDGTATVGNETSSFARGDHVHPTDTSRASQSDFIAHTGNTSNPHGVTKEQVDLGSVEDHPMDDTPTNESQNYVTSGGVKSALDEKQDVANLDTSMPTSPSDGHYPSTSMIKEFVNSSIATNTATFRGTFNIFSDLELPISATQQQIISKINEKVSVRTLNDYVFISIPHDALTPTVIERYDRYKYSTDWAFEYTLNNSSFTATQWDAINSGITEGKVSEITSNTAARHTHSNKGLLDTYNQTNADISDAVSKKHTHTNKALLDTYDQTNADISDAVSKKHVHTNKSVLDSITAPYTTEEKSKLHDIAPGAQVNSITGVKGDAESNYRTGEVNITKGNVGLSNVDNTSDANKPISTATQNALNNKVDKLSTSPAGNGFVKVNVNAQGQVTGHSAMVEGDIPALSISKTSGLQSAIDSKLTIPQVVGPGAENNEECYVVTTSTSESLPLPSGVSTGSDHTPIKIVNGTAVAVAHTLMDLDTEQIITAKKHIPTATAGDSSDVWVNKAFVQQSGAGKPNNLVHDYGDEDVYGTKTRFNNDVHMKNTSVILFKDNRPASETPAVQDTIYEMYTVGSDGVNMCGLFLITFEDGHRELWADIVDCDGTYHNARLV